MAVAFFGDGAVAQGAFHEAVNLAAVWRLPVVFFCENNGYAEFSAAADAARRAAVERRAAGYGVEHVAVDGNDVVAVASGDGRRSSPACRAGDGPVLVEATTYRWHGHYEGDPERYRSADEVQEWQARDPLLVHARRLAAAGVDDETLKSLEDDDRPIARRRRRRRPPPAATGPRHADQLRRTPRPSPAEPSAPVVDAHAHADAPVSHAGDTIRAVSAAERPSPPAMPEDGPVFRTMDAIRPALEAELAADERVFVAGIDVAAGGNVFGLTRGLHERFGERVRDTPISETAIVGLGVGAAMAGMRPVVELMYLDFVGVCLDQLLNQAAKLPFMTGGAAEMALTVRTQFGAGRSSGSQHSQSLEALLAHIPGLTVVMPSTPADTYGLLRAAIQDPNPVVFIENRLLYGIKGPQPPRRPHRPHRPVRDRAPRHRRHRRLGVAHGPRGPRRRRDRWPATASRSRSSTSAPSHPSTWPPSSTRSPAPAGC